MKSKIRSSKQAEEAREKKNKLILSILISVIMIGSVLGIFVYKDDLNNIRTYKAPDGKKYEFISATSEVGLYGYVTKVDKKAVFFYNFPEFLINASNITDEAMNLLNSDVYYFTFNPEDTKYIEFIELARFNVAEEYAKNNKYLISAKTQNSTNYPLYPIIDCANASATSPVLKFVSSNSTSIRNEGYCIIFEGKQYDFLMYRDLLIYKLYRMI